MSELIVRKNKIEVSDWYLQNIKLIEQHSNGSTPELIKLIHEESIQKLIELGFPTQKVEDWKYTNVLSIVEKKFKPSNFTISWKNQDVIAKAKLLLDRHPIISDLSSFQLVFIDGHYVNELSRINTTEIFELNSLRNSLKEKSEILEKHFNRYSKIENGFNALNNLFFTDGIFVYVKDNVIEDEPIVVVFIQSGAEEQIVNPRNLFVVGKNAKIKFIETYLSLEGEQNFTNQISEIYIDENSYVEHFKLHFEDIKNYHIGKVQTLQERNSNFTSFNISFGGMITRNDVNIVLNGEGAEAHMFGLYFVKDKQHIDNHTFVDHAKPHCMSNEFYKGILAENSRGVFNGKIMVRKGAQKTNAYQSNKNLLLSGNAKIDTKPQLEIFADDVRCTHGATVGQVDDDSLFYLRARGIDEKSARSLLVNAFANDVLQNISFEILRDKLSEFVIQQMNEILEKNS